MTYQPPEDVVRGAMDAFGLTHEEAVEEMRRVDVEFGIADEDES